MKARVLQACAAPGASVAAVAREYGLNDNLVHQWRRGRGIGVVAGKPADHDAPSAPQFIALPLPAASAIAATQPTTAANIQLEIRRGAVVVNVTWPMTAADQCAVWLREVLR